MTASVMNISKSHEIYIFLRCTLECILFCFNLKDVLLQSVKMIKLMTEHAMKLGLFR